MSPSRRATRPRSAPRSATISKRRSIRRRRCAGAAPPSIRPIRSLPEGVEPLSKSCQRAAGAGAPAAPDRRGRSRRCAARSSPLLKPGQRLVSREGDLWRWDGFAVAANAPTGAARRLAGAQSPGRDRSRAAERARRSRGQARGRHRRRGRSGGGDPGRDRRPHRCARIAARRRRRARARTPTPSASSTSIPSRLSALTEAKARLGANRAEALTAQTRRSALADAIAGRPPSWKTKLGEVRGEMTRTAGPCRIARGSAGAGARGRDRQEAAGGDRRRAAVLDRHQGARPRRRSPRWKRASPKPRPNATSLVDAPQAFEEKRVALISAGDRRPKPRSARPATGWRKARPRSTEANRAVRAALEALGAAREQSARSEERCEGAKRRLTDIAHEIRDMLEVEPRASRRWPRSSRRRSAAGRCRGRGRAREAAARARTAWRGQSARRGGIARGRDPAHLAGRPNATIWSRRSSGCGRASRT